MAGPVPVNPMLVGMQGLPRRSASHHGIVSPATTAEAVAGGSADPSSAESDKGGLQAMRRRSTVPENMLLAMAGTGTAAANGAPAQRPPPRSRSNSNSNGGDNLTPPASGVQLKPSPKHDPLASAAEGPAPFSQPSSRRSSQGNITPNPLGLPMGGMPLNPMQMQHVQMQLQQQQLMQMQQMQQMQMMQQMQAQQMQAQQMQAQGARPKPAPAPAADQPAVPAQMPRRSSKRSSLAPFRESTEVTVYLSWQDTRGQASVARLDPEARTLDEVIAAAAEALDLMAAPGMSLHFAEADDEPALTAPAEITAGTRLVLKLERKTKKTSS